LWIFKNVAVFVSSPAQHLCRQLRGNLDPRHGPVFRDIANLVDPDAGLSGQCRFQLFGQLARLVVAARKRAHKPRKVSLCGVGRKMNAGDSGTD
jgi:hypothetical protein